MSVQGKTISREELYQQVWKIPISRLAVELGYTYLELVKICADLGIPRPSGGYWYRLQHGGASEQVPLPPRPKGGQNEIPLGPRLHAELPPELPDYVGEPEVAVTPASAPKKLARKVKAEKPALAREEAAVPDESSTDSKTSIAPTRVAPNFADVVEMTREELYQHVWTTPMHLLSEALGLLGESPKNHRREQIREPGRAGDLIEPGHSWLGQLSPAHRGQGDVPPGGP